ncbi:hypothetical protein AVEN_104170-1 [Araneus ventricosus]|uniref:Uncharacterized protein n=1 Tax=Araneus ventricosus TaxID=182803 RepID=A0A4Y2QPG0_ARAVE|nr:hypothetical protein AVEN_104170-1 [Araneus ventricosus]
MEASSFPFKSKTEPFVLRTITTKFWINLCLLMCVILERCATINSERCCETLQKLHTVIGSRRLERLHHRVKLLNETEDTHMYDETEKVCVNGYLENVALL